MTDYNLMTPQDMDALLFSPFQIALGQTARERISTQIANYEYYGGKQHEDVYGNLVMAKDLPRPFGIDYDPTRYSTNYFKAIVDKKARWQMGGTHGINVPRKRLDDADEVLRDGYKPSDEQIKENRRAESYERLLYRLWDDNKMRATLIQAARDRLIADRVVCKIVFNQRTGRLHWVWVPDNEFIPIFTDDDFKDLIGAHFVKHRKWKVGDNEVDAIQIQTYRMADDGYCTFKNVIYAEVSLDVLHVVTPEGSLGLDFMPIQLFSVSELITENMANSEISDLRTLNNITNQMNEDASDSLKFEMFPMTAVFNAPEGTADKMEIAPGATIEARGDIDGQAPEIKKIESSFKWNAAFKDQYARVKSAMHEITGLPQVVPQELNFGGLNGEALQVMFHDIITDTEEHWLSWGYNLSELHEKSIRYLQAMIDETKFAYEKDVVRDIGDNFDNEMRFVLPLPDNRKELVELLDLESASGFESTKGALERLGVENVQSKLQEIEGERSRKRQTSDPYGE